jgi:hypothetical protein
MDGETWVKPEIKQAYIDLCLAKGKRTDLENNTPFSKAKFVHRYTLDGLNVLCVPDTQPPAVFGTYWSPEDQASILRAVQLFEHACRVHL